MSVTLNERHEVGLVRRSWCAIFLGWPVSLLTAIQFLSVVPPVIRRAFAPAELGRAVGWFAVVGIMLGAVLAGVDYVLSLLFPAGVIAALLLVVWALMTGVLHLDGFLDTCDGLFGGRTPEERLRIMRDERVGAFAVIGGALLLLVKYSCLVNLTSRTATLIVAPTLGRWGMALAVVAFPYARPEGTGRWMKDHAGWRQVILASITAFVPAILLAKWLGLIAIGLAAAATVAIAVFTLRRTPGFTGDVYGALCELLEALVLLVFAAGERA
jgi:adenosylcobinamide-GDP ribazoletransferase